MEKSVAVKVVIVCNSNASCFGGSRGTELTEQGRVEQAEISSRQNIKYVSLNNIYHAGYLLTLAQATSAVSFGPKPPSC